MRYGSLAVVALVGLVPKAVVSQSSPGDCCAPVITIGREVEKFGHTAAHLRLEAEWVAALARAGYAVPGFGFVSESGVAEAWFVSGYASFEEMAKATSALGSGKAGAVMERFAMLDAAHVDNIRTLVATLRPDLSQGQINLVTMRGAEMSTWRIRPGHDDHFAEAFKTYMGAAKRAGVTPAMATYQVVAGAPAGTYISFSAKRSMADYDKDMKESEMIGRGFTAEEGASLNKFLADGTASLETNRFHVDPNISLVGDDMIKADPAFWTPSWKKAMPAKPAKP